MDIVARRKIAAGAKPIARTFADDTRWIFGRNSLVLSLSVVSRSSDNTCRKRATIADYISQFRSLFFQPGRSIVPLNLSILNFVSHWQAFPSIFHPSPFFVVIATLLSNVPKGRFLSRKTSFYLCAKRNASHI